MKPDILPDYVGDCLVDTVAGTPDRHAHTLIEAHRDVDRLDPERGRCGLSHQLHLTELPDQFHDLLLHDMTFTSQVDMAKLA
jgi:hypothetical protein